MTTKEKTMSEKKMQVVLDGYPFKEHKSVTEFVQDVSQGLTIVSVSHNSAHGGRVHVILVLSGTEDQVEAHRARLEAEKPERFGDKEESDERV